MNNCYVKKTSRIPASTSKCTKPSYVKPVIRLLSSYGTFIILKYYSLILEYSCCILAFGAGPGLRFFIDIRLEITEHVYPGC